MHKVTVSCLSVLLVCLTIYVETFDAQHLSARYVVEADNDAACEVNSRHLDTLVGRAKDADDRIFIITRLGKKEKSGILERARLTQAFSLLTRIKGINSDRVVTAIGERTAGTNGQLEFYFGSELFLISKAKPGKQICLACCD